MADSLKPKGERNRLSQIVNESGVDAFTRDDFFQVSGHVSLEPERLILVGGQALETWGVLLDVLAPTGDRHPLTEDTDWLGSADDAAWLAQLLGAQQTVELKRATLDDNTPNTAVLLLETGDGRILLMDFLHSITGLAERDIKALAVPIDIPHKDGHVVTLRVLHPLHCLASRMANLKTHPAKRQGNGPMQAAWAIDIVRAFLTHSTRNAEPAQIRKACHKVAELAEYGAGEYCFINFGIDPLAAITPEVVKAGGEGFSRTDWPGVLTRIDAKRRRWAAKLHRVAKH